MSQRSFFLQLLLLTLGAAAALFFLHRHPRLEAHASLSWIALGLFVALSALMYFAGLQSARSDNKHHFTNTVIGFTLGKMMLSAMTILAYYKVVAPSDKLFILPFFAVYLIYTIFETYFMTRLGRVNT